MRGAQRAARVLYQKCLRQSVLRSGILCGEARLDDGCQKSFPSGGALALCASTKGGADMRSIAGQFAMSARVPRLTTSQLLRH